MSIVAQQYNILSQQLREGIAGFQKHQTAQAEAGMKQAQMEYQVRKEAPEMSRGAQELVEMNQQLTPARIGARTEGQQLMVAMKILPAAKEDLGWEVDEDGFYTLGKDGKTKIPVKSTKANKQSLSLLIGLFGEAENYTKDLINDIDQNLDTASGEVEAKLIKDRAMLVEQLADIKANPAKYLREKIYHVSTQANLLGNPDFAKYRVQGMLKTLQGIHAKEAAQAKRESAVRLLPVWKKDKNGEWQFAGDIHHGKNQAFQITDKNKSVIEAAHGGTYGEDLMVSPTKPSSPKGTLTEDQIQEKFDNYAIYGPKSGEEAWETSARMSSEFSRIQKENPAMSRWDILSRVLRENDYDPYIDPTSNQQEGDVDYGHLWKKD